MKNDFISNFTTHPYIRLFIWTLSPGILSKTEKKKT